MQDARAVEQLTEEEARAELEELAEILLKANHDYHAEDAPKLSDAEYDRLKARNAAIEARFPGLKRADSPTDAVGAAPSGRFGKVTHAQRMMSLGNAFEAGEIAEFDERLRKYLGLAADAPLAYTAEPKIRTCSTARPKSWRCAARSI
jgi:DNA ligase (NAD+)